MCILLIFVLGVAGRLTYEPSMVEWTDRDVQRTIGVITGTHFPLVGPETNSGGFLPGPFFYFILSPLYIFSHSPYTIGFFNSTLNIVSIILFLFIIRKRYPLFCVTISFGLLCFSTIHASSFGSPINPSFILILNCIFLFFLFKIFIDLNEKYFLPAIIIIALGSQIHFSFSSYLSSLLVLSLFIKRPRIKTLFYSIMVIFVSLIPYLYYQLSLINIQIFRTYKQFSASNSFYELLPLQIFKRIIWHPTIDPAYSRIKEIFEVINPDFGTNVTKESVWLYTQAAFFAEGGAMVLAFFVALGLLTYWSIKTRFQFSENQRKFLVPFLAVLPIMFIWQWGGIVRHGHDWYSYIFFPIVPLWMGTSLEYFVSWFRQPWQKIIKIISVIILLIFSLKVTTYYKTVFFPIKELNQNILDIKNTTGFTKDLYSDAIFFIDRPKRTSNPDSSFLDAPWGIYSDYMYNNIGKHLTLNNSSLNVCYLVSHKNFLTTEDIDYFKENISNLFDVVINKVITTDRLTYFAYPRLKSGNCFHNTINAWVISEQIGQKMSKIPKGKEVAVLKNINTFDSSSVEQNRKIDFAVFDKKAQLAMNILMTFEKEGKGSLWQVFLKSPSLMGHLNNTNAYSGLFRKWAKLWLEDFKIVIKVGDETKIARFHYGEIGKLMFTPLKTKKIYIDQKLSGKDIQMYLTYKTVVSSPYKGEGVDIQQLIKKSPKTESWKTTIVLYGNKDNI